VRCFSGTLPNQPAIPPILIVVYLHPPTYISISYDRLALALTWSPVPAPTLSIPRSLPADPTYSSSCSTIQSCSHSLLASPSTVASKRFVFRLSDSSSSYRMLPGWVPFCGSGLLARAPSPPQQRYQPNMKPFFKLSAIAL
jgi:hypothetical protein